MLQMVPDIFVNADYVIMFHSNDRENFNQGIALLITTTAFFYY